MGAVAGTSGAGSGTSGDRIEVDPEVLIRAGQRMGSLGAQLGMLSDALGAVISSGIASGLDPAGLSFALEYGRRAQEFADGLANGANSFKSVGYKLEATGHNYRSADAASTIGGAGPTGGLGEVPSTTTAADAALGPSASVVLPPLRWPLILPFLVVAIGPGAAMWPSGDPAMMRLTAAQWRNLAQGMAIFEGELAAVKTAVSVQNIPEIGQINTALFDLGEGISALADTAADIAEKADTFAGDVQQAQDAIRRLLDRLTSIDGVVDTLKGIFTGEADDILREIARDVGEILDNFQSQVKGVVGLLEALKTAIGDAATAFQKWITPILVATFGEEVGGHLAALVTTYTDFSVGVWSGLINTVSGTVAMADIDTWKGMAELAMSVAKDPSTLDDVLMTMGKEFIAYDQWTGDHPGRGAGEAVFNIASLFNPAGGPLSKSGTVVKGVKAAHGALKGGKLPSLSDLPGLKSGNHNLDELDDLAGLGSKAPDVQEFTPAIPESVINPNPPSGFDGPTAPRGFENPAGPPDPPGPAGTSGRDYGGDGPPPDPPGRPVGPSEAGPGRAEGPSAQPPATSGPGQPSHSPPSAEPPAPSPGEPTSSGGQAPSGAHDAPETPSPTGQHDPGSRADGDTPASNEPSTPETQGAGHTPEQHGYAAGDGAVDNAGHRGTDNDMLGDNHRTGSSDYNGRPDERTHTPADHQRAHVAEPASHGGDDRANLDNGTSREQTPGDGNSFRQDSGGVAPGMMPMIGGPMGQHGPMHSPGDGQTAAGRAQTPETPTRNAESKAQQGGSLGNARSQPSSTTGAAAAHSPTAPVKPAASHTVSDASDGAIRSESEARTSRSRDNVRDDALAPARVTHETPAAQSADRPGNQADPSQPRATPETGSGLRDEQKDRPGPVGNPADARVYGPHELDPVEDPAYQAAVEDALRSTGGGYLVHADPRMNDYGQLINDGGPSVIGRSNNCLDCCLAALSSFLGDPTVSAPRHRDELPTGEIDRVTGEHSGLRRAAEWIGRELLEFQFPRKPLANHFDALHEYIANAGPGSAALVVNGWHAIDPHTLQFLNHPDGSPITDGSHATVVVYPEGADGPVWWDPQDGSTSDRPPAWMVEQSTYLHFTPVESGQGAHHGTTENDGRSPGIPGADVADREIPRGSVRPWMGGDESADAGADELWSGGGFGSTGDRFGDRDRLSVPELVDDESGGGSHDVQTDGRQPSGSADISVSMDHHAAANPGGRPDYRVSAESGVADRPAATDPRTSVDDREAHAYLGSAGSTVGDGGSPRALGEPSEPGRVAGDGHHPGVTGRHADEVSASSSPMETRGDEKPGRDEHFSGEDLRTGSGDSDFDHRQTTGTGHDAGTIHYKAVSSDNLAEPSGQRYESPSPAGAPERQQSSLEQSGHGDPPAASGETSVGSESEGSPETTGSNDAPANFADLHPPLHRENPYPVKYMPGMYSNETDPNHPQNPFPGKSVERWPPEKVEAHRVVVDQHGLLRHIDGRLVDTRGAKSLWSSGGGRAIFTMDPHGNLYVSLEHARGRIHHSTLSSGKPVTGAGELTVVDGRLIELTDNSGHYRPLRSNTQNVIDELANQGIDMDAVSVLLSALEGT
ncbi:methyl-accepting chemotaxis protein [Mycolicibacterium wolinskyi]|uniref:toxin glutamine deamidase domain-containing protein n=1 Tax=Mycolicibacterium TaxID=1866885 RepID=UPI000A16AB92|nr:MULTISPECIES: toxin glutamine deamidase domain-containing protein [Mycolicibacterium]MCV7288948.1 methyl-accepting chemotaxis protein [Mycolicibacterium wolinskyi]MCV7296985.1 methyl-accepting chemotaxis protein [Mycolicibacterium goodii]